MCGSEWKWKGVREKDEEGRDVKTEVKGEMKGAWRTRKETSVERRRKRERDGKEERKYVKLERNTYEGRKE